MQGGSICPRCRQWVEAGSQSCANCAAWGYDPAGRQNGWDDGAYSPPNGWEIPDNPAYPSDPGGPNRWSAPTTTTAGETEGYVYVTSSSGTRSDRPTRMAGDAVAPVAHLVIARGVPHGEAFRLGTLTRIGRDRRKNDVVIGDDDSVSREHGRVQFEDGSFVYYNLSGTYGSYLITHAARQRIEGRLVLCDGDQIAVGERTVLDFRRSGERRSG